MRNAASVIRQSAEWQRARLAELGIDQDEVGRVINRVVPKTVPLPQNSDELAEFVADPGRMRAVLTSPEAFRDFCEEYAKHQQNPETDLAKTIAVETQRAMLNFLRENELDSVKRVNLSPHSGRARDGNDYAAAYNPHALGAEIDKDFADAYDYFRSVHAVRDGAKRVPDVATAEKMSRIANAYSSSIPDAGGFLIPESLRSELLRLSLETAVVRPRARVIPMETLRVPFPMIDSTTNVGSVFGGMVAYWTEEGAALTASQAKFGRVMLEAKKLTAYSEIPNELGSDSIISLIAFVQSAFPEVLSWFEDLAFMRGTGAGEPLGWIGASNLSSVAVAAEAGQATATIVWQNIVKMFARMLPASLNRAVWVASPDTFPELATMALAVGTGGSAIWLGNGAVGAPMTILGRPLIISEKMSALGTRGDIDFVDLGYYLIGDRQTMATAMSTEYKFGNDVTALRVIERVDGRPWLQSPITPQNGGNTLTPFVELATRP
jgi:HK97 family phage major capsid protein